MSGAPEERTILALDEPVVRKVLEAAAPAGRIVWLGDLEAVQTYAAAKPVSCVVVTGGGEVAPAHALRAAMSARNAHTQVMSLDEEGRARDLTTLDPWRGNDAPPPPPGDEIEEILASLLEYARVGRLTGLVGVSDAIASVVRTVIRVAAFDVPVLIQGPSGTGKELVAQSIHMASRRSEEPFLAVNTPGLSETLIESELFGHEKGAFTGASARKQGVFEAAGAGTILLDEIGDLPRGLQSKLLRILEQHEFQRVGGTEAIRVRARVLAATNVDLERAVAGGEFREDLYFRLKVVTIDIPPLRERTEDIFPLLQHFVRLICRERGTDFPGFTEEAVQQMLSYPWPGNARELRNLVEHIILLHPDERVTAARLARILEERSRQPNLPAVTGKSPEQAEREMIFKSLQALREEISDLRSEFTANRPPAAPKSRRSREPGLDGSVEVPLGMPLEDVELMLIRETMQRLGGDKRKTAETLGIGLRTLYRRLEHLQERGSGSGEP